MANQKDQEQTKRSGARATGPLTQITQNTAGGGGTGGGQSDPPKHGYRGDTDAPGENQETQSENSPAAPAKTPDQHRGGNEADIPSDRPKHGYAVDMDMPREVHFTFNINLKLN